MSDPAPRPPTFGQHLRALRERRGLTRMELAVLVRCGITSIYYWEHDQCLPKDSSMLALARALRTTVAALCGQEEQR